MGGSKGYKSRGKHSAEKLGWDVMNYILNVDTDNVPPLDTDLNDMGWPMGAHNAVSYWPAGIGTGTPPNNQDNLTGNEAYNKWLKAMTSVATEVGMELYNFMDKKEKARRKQMSSDSKATLKQQSKDEKTKGIPVVSVIGCLNNDFEGADFMLCGEKIDLKKGDILLFPSNFMYPHEVTETTKGTRYSFVAWTF